MRPSPVEPPQQAKGPVPMNGAGQDRVTENDKVIMDIKAKMRKLRTYEEKLKQQDADATDKIKELLKAGQKQAAIVHLKKKKFVEAEGLKVSGAQIKLQETIQGIESAQQDINIAEALKEGTQVLSDLQKQVDWETVVEDHKEQMALREREVELFGEELADEDLLNELEELEAAEAAGEMAGPIGTGHIAAADAAEYRQAHGIEAQPAQQEPA